VIAARTPFDEIVIAQEELFATQLEALESFPVDHRIKLLRFWLGVCNTSVQTISDHKLASA
jgi:hypothetical protein